VTDIERHDSEMTKFEDPISGRTIWRLTNSQMEDKHSYYDISPWSPDQRYIVFSTANPHDLAAEHRDTMATGRGQVYIMDTETFGLTRIAGGAFYNSHTGAFALWHPQKNRVYFYVGPEQVAVVDVASGQIVHTMSGSIRQLSPDGRKFAWTSNDISSDMIRGVYTMNEDGSDVQLIVSLKDLYELTPNKDEFDIDQMTVGNTKWRPDGQYMLVAMWVKAKPDDLEPWRTRYRRSIYVVGRDGSERRWLTYFGHHHSWTADGQQVLYSGYKTHTSEGVREDPRLYLINFDGTDKRIVIDEPLGGHPIANPDGTMITTWDDESIILVRVPEQKVERLASLNPGFDMTHRGTHPHCIWSLDGRQILYNSAQTGHSQLYLIPIA